MMVYWNADKIHKEYLDSRKTIVCVYLFETNLDYFIQVIGYVSDEHCPDPHIVLRDYVKYNRVSGVDLPDELVLLAKRK